MIFDGNEVGKFVNVYYYILVNKLEIFVLKNVFWKLRLDKKGRFVIEMVNYLIVK